MKKQLYLAPEAQALSVVMESTFICASGENLTPNTTYLDSFTESEFWD